MPHVLGDPAATLLVPTGVREPGLPGDGAGIFTQAGGLGHTWVGSKQVPLGTRGRQGGWLGRFGASVCWGWGAPVCQGNVYDCVKGVSVCG